MKVYMNYKPLRDNVLVIDTEKPEETEKICEEKKEFFTSGKKENAGIVELCRGFLTKPDAKRAALA